jgi:hypothetical protein
MKTTGTYCIHAMADGVCLRRWRIDTSLETFAKSRALGPFVGNPPRWHSGKGEMVFVAHWQIHECPVELGGPEVLRARRF